MNRKYLPGWDCPECGSTNRKGAANGLCKVCYTRQQRRKRGAKPVRSRIRKCARCGEVARIQGHELCYRCYWRMRKELRAQKLVAYEWQRGSRKFFAGNRDLVFERAGHRCERCGMSDSESLKRWGERLHVHHRDGNNYRRETPNHSLENLQLLCKLCHRAIHGNVRRKVSA